MPLTSPGNDDDTGENHQPTLRKNTAEPVEQTLKQNNTRPDRRYSGFRNQYDGLELLHLRVDENRVLCTDFDQYHCVINRWPCAPLDAGTWPPDEYDRWLDEHWDDPAEVKAIQYRANAIVGPKRLPDRWIQACLWTITPHDVVDIRPACGKPDTIGNHG